MEFKTLETGMIKKIASETGYTYSSVELRYRALLKSGLNPDEAFTKLRGELTHGA